MEMNFCSSTCLSPIAAVRSAIRLASSVSGSPNPSGLACVLKVFTFPRLSFLLAFVKVRHGGAACTQVGTSCPILPTSRENSSSFTRSSPNRVSCASATQTFPLQLVRTAAVRPANPANSSWNPTFCSGSSRLRFLPCVGTSDDLESGIWSSSPSFRGSPGFLQAKPRSPPFKCSGFPPSCSLSQGGSPYTLGRCAPFL